MFYIDQRRDETNPQPRRRVRPRSGPAHLIVGSRISPLSGRSSPNVQLTCPSICLQYISGSGAKLIERRVYINMWVYNGKGSAEPPVCGICEYEQSGVITPSCLYIRYYYLWEREEMEIHEISSEVPLTGSNCLFWLEDSPYCSSERSSMSATGRREEIYMCIYQRYEVSHLWPSWLAISYC